MKHTNQESNLDDRLSDFTDRVLAGETDQIDPNADDKLRDLEETILRLKRAISRKELSEATGKQWEVRFTNRLHKEHTPISFWQKWFGVNWRYGQFRPQAALAIGIIVLLTLAVLAVVNFSGSGSSVIAAAFVRNRTIFTAGALLVLVLMIVWTSRRR